MRIVPALFSSVIVVACSRYEWQPPQIVLPLGPIRLTIPTTSLLSMMESQFACQTARPATPGTSCVIVSLRRFGTRATTARCRTSSRGRKPGVFACGFCHRATGPGVPENADLAGLPKSYIIQQMADYKTGARSTTLAGRTPPKLMIELSKLTTDAEIEAAAAYFSALQPRKRIKVVESDTAPKTYVAGLLWAAVETGEREPIGARIVEVPDDLLRFESRDPRSTFTAYAPIRSLAKGEALVLKGGSGKTIQCALCHGADLRGLGPLPSIAGRSPSYMFRQLYDFRHGARTGEWSPLMVQVVATLDEQDLLAIVAYLASRDP